MKKMLIANLQAARFWLLSEFCGREISQWLSGMILAEDIKAGNSS